MVHQGLPAQVRVPLDPGPQVLQHAPAAVDLQRQGIVQDVGDPARRDLLVGPVHGGLPLGLIDGGVKVVDGLQGVVPDHDIVVLAAAVELVDPVAQVVVRADGAVDQHRPPVLQKVRGREDGEPDGVQPVPAPDGGEQGRPVPLQQGQPRQGAAVDGGAGPVQHLLGRVLPFGLTAEQAVPLIEIQKGPRAGEQEGLLPRRGVPLLVPVPGLRVDGADFPSVGEFQQRRHPPVREKDQRDPGPGPGQFALQGEEGLPLLVQDRHGVRDGQIEPVLAVRRPVEALAALRLDGLGHVRLPEFPAGGGVQLPRQAVGREAGNVVRPVVPALVKVLRQVVCHVGPPFHDPQPAAGGQRTIDRDGLLHGGVGRQFR